MTIHCTFIINWTVSLSSQYVLSAVTLRRPRLTGKTDQLDKKCKLEIRSNAIKAYQHRQDCHSIKCVLTVELQAKRTCLTSSVQWERPTTKLVVSSTNQSPALRLRPLMTFRQHASQVASMSPTTPYPWRRCLATLVTEATVSQLARASWFVD